MYGPNRTSSSSSTPLDARPWTTVRGVFVSLTKPRFSYIFYGLIFRLNHQEATMKKNAFVVLLGLFISGCATCSDKQYSPVLEQISGEHFSNAGCDTKCQTTINAVRSRYVGVEQNEVRYVLTRIQREYSGADWQAKLQTCLDRWTEFQTAENYTLYPAALLAGQAYIESRGCQMLRSTDGGYGPMQITSPETRHIHTVATMLHISETEVSWKTNYLHNVLLGAVMLSAYEDMFESRGVGIIAYNSGPGATRRYMRKAGISEFSRHVLSDFRGTVPEGFSDGARPKIYVDRVLAGAVLIERAKQRLPTTHIETLSLEDIPGAQPSRNSER